MIHLKYIVCFSVTAQAAISILKRLETVIIFLHDFEWSDEIYVNQVEYIAKSTAASLIQDMLTG